MNYFSTLRVHAHLSSPVFGLKHAFVLKTHKQQMLLSRCIGK